MKNEQQRIAIAGACGWHNIQPNPLHPKDQLAGTKLAGPIVDKFHENPLFGIPDYLNDLNAMHEAEKVLTRGQRDDYIDNLLPADDSRVPYDELWVFTHATAAQRAEAFLRTIEKWEASA